MKKLIVCVSTLLTLWIATRAQALVLFSDTFNYPNGALVGTNSPWIHHSGTTTGEVRVVSGRILLSQTNSEDVSVLLLGQPYPATSNLVLYSSFTINVVAPPSGSGDYFAHFKGTGTSQFDDKIFLTTNGVAAGFFRIGLANFANTPNVLINSNLSYNADYLIVTRYVMSNNTSTIWLNPTAETNSGATAADTGTANPVATFALRESLSGGNGMGTLFVDNLIVGTNFSDVVSAPVIPPGITTQPQGLTVQEGGSANFSVVATGTDPLSYQWRFNGANIANATDSSLELSNVTLSQSGDYSVTITNAAGSTNSAAAALNVNPNTPTPPIITAQPQSQTVSEGSDVSISVSVIGTQPLSYQWQLNGLDIDSATNAVLNLFPVTMGDAGDYSVAITNTVGSTNSAIATLTVNTAPTIIDQPQSQVVSPGADVTFGVTAAGTEPFSYQWQFNGANIAGATNAALTLLGVTANQAGLYAVTVTNIAGSTNSEPAILAVNSAPPPVGVLSYVTYNVKGNFATNWTTNEPQVQAIGHELMYLNPDIITFNEIPNQYTYQMTNFVTAFLPGYYIATNSATDGFIRSVVASRYPIISSQSHLHSSDLAPYGYTNADFTRDLFEALIAVPNFPQPLHVFTVHLKSGQGTDDSSRRGAEASAVSNYLVTVFLATNNVSPYMLSGDMNEDINNPPSSHPQSIQRMINPSTDFRLTTPINPISGSSLTFSIQNTNGLNRRYDYIMPCGLLFSNISASQVFRTDLLTNPPAPLATNDDSTASDHLPVMMVFGNPYAKPFKLTSIIRSNQTVTLTWDSVRGQPYRIEASSNLANWSVFANGLTATGGTMTYSGTAPSVIQFFRVYRLP